MQASPLNELPLNKTATGHRQAMGNIIREPKATTVLRGASSANVSSFCLQCGQLASKALLLALFVCTYDDGQLAHEAAKKRESVNAPPNQQAQALVQETNFSH